MSTTPPTALLSVADLTPLRDQVIEEVEAKFKKLSLHPSDLIDLEGKDWHALGREAGEHGVDLQSIRAVVQAYYEHVAASSQERARVERTFWETVERALKNQVTSGERDRWQAAANEARRALESSDLPAQLTALRETEEGLLAEQQKMIDSDPDVVFERSLSELRQQKIDAAGQLDKAESEMVTQILADLRRQEEQWRKAELKLGEQIGTVQERLVADVDTTVQEQLHGRIAALRKEVENVRTLRQEATADCHAAIKGKTETFAAARQVFTEQIAATKTVTQALGAPEAPPRPRGNLYSAWLGGAFLVAVCAELALLYRYTSTLLEVGDPYELIKTLAAAETWADGIATGLQLLFLFSFGGIAFILSFVTKGFLDREGGARWSPWVLALAGLLGLGYIGCVAMALVWGDSLESSDTPLLGFAVFGIAGSLALMAGWLQHHLFAERDKAWRLKQDAGVRGQFAAARMAAVDARIAATRQRRQDAETRLQGLATGVSGADAALAAFDATVAAADANRLRTLAFVQAQLAARDPSETATKASQAARATLEAGYAAGAQVRRAGEATDQLSLESLLARIQKMTLQNVVSSVGGATPPSSGQNGERDPGAGEPR